MSIRLNQKIIAGAVDTSSNKANVDLDNLSEVGEKHFLNKSEITNCLLEIPQTIKVDLTDGVLTFKAGTIIIVPYGIEDLTEQHPVGSVFLNNAYKVCDTQYVDGKFFVWVELQNDVSVNTGATTTRYTHQLFKMNDGTYGNNVIENCLSGDTEPTKSCIFYNTVTNKINYLNHSDETLASIVLSFPVSSATLEELKYKSLDQVFNGMGYIGSTIFADKGVKVLIPNGRNEDGTLNNREEITPKVYTVTASGTVSNYSLVLNKDGLYILSQFNTVSGSQPTTSGPCYTIETNKVYNNGSQRYWVHLANFSTNAGVFTNLDFKLPFRAVDYNELIDYKNYTDTLENTKVSKTGDTMTGSLISEQSSFYQFVAKSTVIDATATPASTQHVGIDFKDKNNVRLGWFGICHDKNGNTYANLLNFSNASDGFQFPRCTTKATTTSSAANHKVAVITQNYVNGTSWYRVWSDGWIEQGGYIAGASANSGNLLTITFLKSFSNTNYTPHLTKYVTSWTSSDVDAGIQTKEKNTMSLLYNGATGCYWTACGY